MASMLAVRLPAAEEEVVTEQLCLAVVGSVLSQQIYECCHPSRG